LPSLPAAEPPGGSGALAAGAPRRSSPRPGERQRLPNRVAERGRERVPHGQQLAEQQRRAHSDGHANRERLSNCFA
jgi:hypothetical protein